jgi:hypothetical protein
MISFNRAEASSRARLAISKFREGPGSMRSTLLTKGSRVGSKSASLFGRTRHPPVQVLVNVQNGAGFALGVQ